MDKRLFLKSSVLLGLNSLVSINSLGNLFQSVEGTPLDTHVADEDFWQAVRSHYSLKDEYINLESGYYNILPRPILERYLQHIRDVNLEGAYYMRTVQFENKQRVAGKLAELAG